MRPPNKRKVRKYSRTLEQVIFVQLLLKMSYTKKGTI